MKSFLYIVMIFFISLLVFEFFLRYSPFSRGVSPVIYDPNIGMWHKKNFDGYIVQKCYKTLYSFDSEGRIKNNYFYDDSKKDIVLLGDSQIEALMVKNSNILHNQLHNSLNGKYNVLNYGLSGTGPIQQYHILKNKVNLSNTDTILHFIFLENDLEDADNQNLDMSNRPKVHMEFKENDNHQVIYPKKYDAKEKIRDFLGHFELYGYLKETFYYYKQLLKYPISKKSDADSNEKSFFISNESYKWKQLQGAIYQIQSFAHEHGVKYKIIVISQAEREGDSSFIKRFEMFLKQFKISYFNILPFLEELELKQRIDFPCDKHWNDTTHQELAAYISMSILE